MRFAPSFRHLPPSREAGTHHWSDVRVPYDVTVARQCMRGQMVLLFVRLRLVLAGCIPICFLCVGDQSARTRVKPTQSVTVMSFHIDTCRYPDVLG